VGGHSIHRTWTALASRLADFIPTIRLRRERDAARREAHAARARLNEVLEALPDAVVLFDAEGRYVQWNRKYADMFPADCGLRPGLSFEEFLRDRAASGTVLAASGRVEEWIAERLARQAQPSNTEEQELKDGRWVRIEERRMADGGTVSIRFDITGFKRREASFRLMFDANPLPMWVFDRETLQFLAVNDAALAHYGYTRDQFLALKLTDIRAHEGEDFHALLSNSGIRGTRQTWRHRRADGTLIHVSIFLQRLIYQGRLCNLAAIVDVTERITAEEELRRTREFLDTIVENVPTAIMVKDARDFSYILTNRAGEQLLGMSREQFIGKTAHAIYGPETAAAIEEHDRELATSGRDLYLPETPMQTGGNEVRIVSAKRLAIADSHGKTRYLLTVAQDDTDKVEARKRVEYMAHNDMLTGLPNRAAFVETIDAKLRSAEGRSFTVLCLDLDEFKEANDLFGHAVGDALLVEVTRRLKEEVGDAFLARVGGDEFMLIVSDGEQPAAAQALGAKLIKAVAQEFHIEGHALRIGLSIGAAVYPADADDLTTLLANADIALYRAKAEGKGTMRFFDADMGRRLRERRALQHDLQAAIGGNQFELHYQPQARLYGEIIGFEALVRWRHPQRGLVSPGSFIPLAEESGLILPMSEWILREGCREAASWPKPLRLALNLSPVQFRQGNLVPLVHSVLLESGLAPSRLELEITEGVLIEDFSQAIAILRQLKAMGVRIAMDDFGTGYSSLSYLQAFPFDKIKIDQTFISNIGHSQQSIAIVRAIISLASGLDLPVLAEGVETKEQLAILASEGCHEVQGYYVGRPRPIRDYGELTGASSSLPPAKALLAG